MNKSFPGTTSPDPLEFPLIPRFREKQYPLVEDQLANYVNYDALTGYGLFDEISYLAEERSGYKFKSKYRYIDPFSDFGAKKIFGDKELLISFYNLLLQKHTKFNVLGFTSAEALGKTQEDRTAIFDLNSRNEKGERFILEIQKESQPDFMSRIIYYATFVIQNQIPKGKRKARKYRFKRVFMVGILNFNLDDSNQYLKEYAITDLHGTEVLEELTITILQMPKFKKKEHELKTGLDKYLYCLKHMRKLKERPKALFEKEYKLLFELAEIANLTPEEMEQYDRNLQLQMDDENKMQYRLEKREKRGERRGEKRGERRGEKRGERRGEKRGEKRGVYKVAKNLKECGASIELIIRSTGLTKEQILQL